MDDTNEALKIWDALKPMVDREIKERTASCIRSKKMTVISAPNGTTIGVCEPFDTVSYNIPYSSAVNGAQVGDAVWVQWYFDNASTMIAVCYGDGLNDYNIPSFPLSIANGGTGQTTKANVKSAFDIDDLEDAIGNAEFVNKTGTSGASVVFNFSNSCAYIIFISGSAGNLRSIIWGYCTGAGAIGVSKMDATSSTVLSTATATNKLTINNSGSATFYATLLKLSGTAPT